MSYEADKMDELEHEVAFENSELGGIVRAQRDKYAASLFVARAWLQIQANRKGSLLFTSELRKAAEIALEIIADPELCLKAHDEARDKEKDHQIQQLRNVLAEAARKLLCCSCSANIEPVLEIARFLGYSEEYRHAMLDAFLSRLDAFLSSVSVSEPNA